MPSLFYFLACLFPAAAIPTRLVGRRQSRTVKRACVAELKTKDFKDIKIKRMI